MSESGVAKLFARFPVVDTERLRLRAMHEDDVAAVFAIFSDAAVMRHYDRRPMRDREEAAMLVARWREAFEAGRAVRWGITLVPNDAVVGTVGLRIESAWRGSLGCDLASGYWRRGLIAEALGAVIELAFTRAELERLEALVMPGNEASEALLRSLGFEREGLLRRYAYFKDAHQDLQCFSLLREA